MSSGTALLLLETCRENAVLGHSEVQSEVADKDAGREAIWRLLQSGEEKQRESSHSTDRNLRRLPQRDESAVILLTGHRGNDAPGPGHTHAGKRMRVPISGKIQFCQICAANQSPLSALACRKTLSRVMLKSDYGHLRIRRLTP